jgi:signal transduction histidine kinase
MKDAGMKPLERSSLYVLLVAGVAISLAAGFLWLHLATPFDGVRLQPGAQVWQPNGVVVTPLREQADGLHAGDLVVAVDGRSMESWAQMIFQAKASRPQWRIDETVTYTIERNGRLIDLPVTRGRYPFGTVVAREWGTILFALVSFLVATVVFLRRHTDPAARVLFLWASSILAATTWSFGLHVGDIINGIGFWLYKATTFGAYMLFWIAGLHFALIFPQPHSLVTRHAWLIPAIYAAPFAIYPVYLAAAWPGSASVLEWLGRWILGEGALAVLYLAAAIAGSVTQYRISRGSVARQKIRWVVFAGMVSLVGGLCLWNLPGLVLGYSIIDANALGLLVLPFPLAIAIAIVRHQLFDIDRILSRTLVYGGLTSCIVGIYVLIVGYLGAVFNARGNLAISLIATGVVAVLFQPLRERLQRGVNRLMYGERDEPYAVISRMGQRLEATIAPDAVLHTIVDTVRESLKLPYVAIALTHEGEGEIAAEAGDGATGRQGDTEPRSASSSRSRLVCLPLTYQHEPIGQLLLAPRDPDESFSVADRRLLDDLARQAGIAIHAVRLTRDLQRSRERLITAREEERRRLRRDLHDGLGPQLASLTLTLAAAHELLRHDVDAADRLLQELAIHSQAAIADIRRLVYDLRPPALDDLGLVLAVREQAAHYSQAGLQITIDAPDHLPPLPAAVEVAAYRIVQEALTNVVRHAQARTCAVRLTLGDALELEIRDDGVGLPPDRRAGVGLTSMRERTAELGGTYQIESLPGEGTCIHARLPLHQEGV